MPDSLPPDRGTPGVLRTLRRVLLGIGMACALLVTLVLLQALSARSGLEHGEDQAAVLGDIYLQESHLFAIAAAQRGFAITGDERALDGLATTISELEAGYVRIRRHVQTHQGHDGGDPHAQLTLGLVSSAEADTRAYVNTWVLPSIARVRGGDASAVIADVVDGPGVRRRLAALATLKTLREVEAAEEIEVEQRAGVKYTLATALAVGSLLFAFGIGVGAVILFRKKIVHPVVRASAVATRIAAGEPHLRIGALGAGEVRNLTEAIDKMAEAAESNQAKLAEQNRHLENSRHMLERDQALLQAVLETTPAVACLFDSEGTLILSNRPTDQIPQIAFAPDSAEGTVEIESPAGRWYRRVTRLLGGPGDDRSRVVVVDDITAEKAADQAKADLIATVSHEMRTPLTALLGYSEALARDAGDGDRVRRYASTIHNEASRLTRLVGDLLDLQQIERGQLTLERRPLDLGDVVRDQISLFRSEGQRERLMLSAPTTPTMVEGDEVRLGQVVGNLVANALKYSADGPITVEITTGGGRALVSVRDEGIGISADELPHLFDRFYRGSTGALGNVGGSGLGLAVAREIVQAHGGSITATSRLGFGSTFTVDLPMATQTPN